jgi:periplasmic protein TonB
MLFNILRASVKKDFFIEARQEVVMTFTKIGKADIRSRARRRVKVSLIVVLFLFIGVFGYFFALEREAVASSAAEQIITVQVIDRTRQLRQPPPPHRPPISVQADDPEPLPNRDLKLDDDPSVTTPEPQLSPVQSTADDESFYPIEEAPEIIGGMNTLMKHLVYPDFAIRAGIEGAVTVLAYVNKEGVVVRTEVLSGIGGGCDEAAMEAVRQVRFKPAEQRGKPVNIKASVLVRFRIK